MNDCNQRNTALRKLPGIHPEYIIHTGVPRGGVLLWVKRSRAAERTQPGGREACPRGERGKAKSTIHRGRDGPFGRIADIGFDGGRRGDGELGREREEEWWRKRERERRVNHPGGAEGECEKQKTVGATAEICWLIIVTYGCRW
ncbi:hypothetical protein KM043_017251 [Ampulex compressa]|nr:hypothetical protein KM043_017251 [Ampulex compressa]